jgi:hypothetical protein
VLDETANGEAFRDVALAAVDRELHRGQA